MAAKKANIRPNCGFFANFKKIMIVTLLSCNILHTSPIFTTGSHPLQAEINIWGAAGDKIMNKILHFELPLINIFA